MRLRLLVLAAFAATSVAAFPATAAPDCKGLPTHTKMPVVDAANVVEPQAEGYLDADLLRYHFEGHQAIVAVTVPTLGGDDVASYAKRLFDCWGIGDADSDNGVLILVAMREHRTRIALGAGLEGKVSAEDLDSALSVMVPPLRSGDVAGALRAAAMHVADDLGGTLPDTAGLLKGSGGDATTGTGSTDTGNDAIGGGSVRLPSQYTGPEVSPFAGDDSSNGIAVLVPVVIVAGLVVTVLRAVVRGGFGVGGGGSSWRGGFPGYRGGGWSTPSVFHSGGWSSWGSSDSGSSSWSGSSSSMGGGGGSSSGGSFGGGSSGGGGASGSW